jgi:hypothetical protein
MSEILVEKGELFGLGRRFENDLAAVRDVMQHPKAGHCLHRRLAQGRREVRALAVGSFVARHQLGPVPGQD